MAVPALTVRADWNNDGDFTGLYDLLSPLDEQELSIKRGRSADFQTEAMGACSFVLDNDDDSYSPDRNWHDNPSFEDQGTTGWSILAIASLTAAATSITQVTDTAGIGTGTKAGEAVLTATINSGVTYPIPYHFNSGQVYSISVYLKSVSGTTSVKAGMASAGTPADIASMAASAITGSWAQYTFTWTPSADRTDAVFFVRTTAAATGTVRIDAINVNPGSTGFTFREAPTKGQLVPGRPIHVYATYSAVDYPLFYGFIERITPDPDNRNTIITCYDVLRKMSEFDAVASAGAFVNLTAREHRIRALSDFERGNRNLIANPSFETNTTGWTDGFGIASRLTTDAAPGAGTCCMQIAATAGSQYVTYAIYGQRAAYFAGETYVFSIYARTTSGTQTWSLQCAATGVTSSQGKVITVTTAWTRFYVTWTLSADIQDNDSITLFITSLASGTARFDGAAFVRGTALVPYADVGTGRLQNLCANASFEGSASALWYDGWANIITNPSFETDASGWVATADSFHAAGTAPTRVTTGTHKFGSAHGETSISASTTQGIHFAITGTFVSGVTYKFSVWVHSTTNAVALKIGIGSNGTATDKTEVLASTVPASGYLEATGTWVPSANRTDAHFYVAGNSSGSGDTVKVDGAYVFRSPIANGSSFPEYSNTGPGGGGSFVTSTTQVSSPVKYGNSSAQMVTPATTGAGKVYDFAATNTKFRSGKTYSVSVWIRSTTAMPYKIGIGALDPTTGNWDENSTTGTLTSNTWTQVTLTWTPSADRDSSTAPYRVVLYVFQTNATGRTFFLDGVRVIADSSADDFEMTHWNIPAAGESEIYLADVIITGTVLGITSAINGSNISRHWIEPTMTSPFYQYNVEDRDTYAAKSVTETVSFIDDWSNTELDRSTVFNVVPITSRQGSSDITDYFSDEASVTKYGIRPYSTIDAKSFLNVIGATAIANAILARYKEANSRPIMTRHNVFANMLQRDLNDILSITVPRFALNGKLCAVLTLETKISDGGLHWVQVAQLEDFPY